MTRQIWFWSLVLLGGGLSLGMLWLTDIPLGVPGEWIWNRYQITPDLIANALLGLLTGAIYLGFVARGYLRLSRADCSLGESAGWQVGLVLMAGIWIWMVQGTGATGPTVGRWPFVIYYPSSSGYFFKARYEAPDARQLLKNYESLMSEGDVLHVGTHPPGLFLVFHGLIEFVDAIPAIVPTLNGMQPAAVREAFDVIHENSVRAARDRTSEAAPLSAADRAVLWLAAMLSFGLSAATVWPLYRFLRQVMDRPVSWLCAAAWPLVPSAAIFLPKSDVAFAFPAMLIAWLWWSAWRRQSTWRAALAGGVWTLGILCSLAFLPVALWLALLSLIDAWPAVRASQKSDELRRAVRTIVPAGVVFLVVMAVVSVWGEIPLWKTYWLNYRNHAGFYAQYSRTYLAWLAVNPAELACAVGFPIFIAAAFGIGSAMLRPGGSRHPLIAPCLATLIVWTWLWLSGKNSGEAARLWIFLMPFAVICSAAWWHSVLPQPSSSRRLPIVALGWLICQAVVCFLTVQRVNGFSMD